MSEAVEVVRVFTNEAGSFGNELGIVWGSAATAGREQQLAAELGFSETVFLAALGGGRCSMRIFTPASELPFAGHPTVGTAWYLASRGTPVSSLAVPAGDVAVRYDGDTTWVSAAASWAPEFTWHPLASGDDVDALDPASFSEGQHYAWAWVSESAIRARMFAPAMGITEDEATGAAAVRITAQLDRGLHIAQGRGSQLRTRVLAGGLIEVGGRTVLDRTQSLPGAS